MPDSGRPEGAIVSVRRRDSALEESSPWDLARIELLACAAPWRTFRWRQRQRHFSGTYWSATECDHVTYESRLELSRLLFADFDLSVLRIISQPFLLRARIADQERKHVPDFLLLTTAEPVVVDVKPRARLSEAEVDFTLSWTRDLVEARGWRYEVWSEPPVVELENLRFLAGFRHARWYEHDLLDELRAEDLFGQPLVEASRKRLGWPEPLVRSALFHLVWTHHFTVDLTRPLNGHVTLDYGVGA